MNRQANLERYAGRCEGFQVNVDWNSPPERSWLDFVGSGPATLAKVLSNVVYNCDGLLPGDLQAQLDAWMAMPGAAADFSADVPGAPAWIAPHLQDEYGVEVDWETYRSIAITDRPPVRWRE